MSDALEKLRKIAPKLNRLCEDPSARVSYELMSDGLIWSDELPPWEELDHDESTCLRGIWHYRASLIVGVPVEKYRTFWEEGQKLFPQWPGYLPWRRSNSWCELFLRQQAKLIADMEALDVRINQQMVKEASVLPQA
jgi:hypothetical protein